MVDVVELFRRANLRETCQFFFGSVRDHAGQRSSAERNGPCCRRDFTSASADSGFPCQSFRVAESDAERKRPVAFVLYRAGPLRGLDIDGFDAQAMALRVLDQHGGAVKPIGWLLRIAAVNAARYFTLK